MLMKMIADLHIHSRFSMATSKEGTPENLDFWARKKGISLIGTGDFTHPVWREELKERLVHTAELTRESIADYRNHADSSQRNQRERNAIVS